MVGDKYSEYYEAEELRGEEAPFEIRARRDLSEMVTDEEDGRVEEEDEEV